jgi:ribonucleoside-diphosphate reductase alpha chain
MKAQERPKSLPGFKHIADTGCGELEVIVNLLEDEVFEVFARSRKPGGCVECFSEALARSISLGLRAGVDLAEYYKTLHEIKCNMPTFSEGEQILSCPDAIAKVLKTYLKEDRDDNK